MNPTPTNIACEEAPHPNGAPVAENESMFRQLFDRSADAIFLIDPATEIFVDCNQAAVQMMRASSKDELLMSHPADLSPELQPDGRTSRERTPMEISRALSKGSHRVEWLARRLDGTELPLEVLLTPLHPGAHTLLPNVCRDISAPLAGQRPLPE